MNSLQFPPLRVNSLQFSPFKGEFFAIFFFLRFFWVKRTKNYSGNGEFFKILIFYFSDWSFSIFNSAFSFPTISSLFLEVKMQIIYEFLTRVYTAHLVYSIPYEYFRCCTSLILVSWSIASFKIIALFRGLFNISKIFVMLKCLPILNLLK